MSAGSAPGPIGSILTCNAGSSSLKLGLFDPTAQEQIATAELRGDQAVAALRGEPGTVRTALARAEIDPESIGAVGHRVVHGGTRHTESIRIGPEVERDITELAPLAPNHNPAALAVIAATRDLLPGVPQVAAFDTAFHATLPPRAYRYPVPDRWYTEWGIRRFGFHGLSHAYCAGRAATMLGRPLADLKLVVCHLGSGCSLAAIAGGLSVATTMGFTPLDGLAMATRPGSLDPGILTYLLTHDYLTRAELADSLAHDSGLKGLAGGTGDIREVMEARARGDARAGLAFDVFIHRLREGIGAMLATLGGLDALVFTGGIGEHLAEVRAEGCRTLGFAGIRLDDASNTTAVVDAVVSPLESPVAVLVIRSREDLMVARETWRVLREDRDRDELRGRRGRWRIP